ncbi:MAG TPA: heme ABC exporter ATP-binding protein CcmA [Candidatus Polarisedimenticolaceae bacterium]|nr:heme ABC exporter ATP-binding protein CcmA [Candidatus Polarisedimenticolaceae bacterium]
MDAAPLLEARGLTRRFGATIALEGIDLAVRRGEPVALFGENGAGKTTLLRLLAGGLKPTAGGVAVEGTDPRRAGAAARSRIGVVSHQTLLYGDLTAEENLVFFATLHGVPSPAARARALLREVDLAERGDDPVRTFSRGLRQRVALARALVHAPPILLLDEPATGLDARSTAAWRRALAEAAARDTTWILATHDVEEGLALCPRWVAIRHGRVADAGSSRGPEADRARARALAP